jgi:hypothetical protein
MTPYLLAAALSISSTAFGAEYREITLANGRKLPAEIKNITSTEMVLATPQGTVIVSPADLKNMAPLTTEAYLGQKPWRVLVLPFSGDENTEKDRLLAHLFALRVLESIPALTAQTVDDLEQSTAEVSRSALQLCGTDISCATRHGTAVGADVVVMGQVKAGLAERILMVRSVFVATPAARKQVKVPYSDTLVRHRSEINSALYESLFLSPPDGAKIPKIPVVATAPTPRNENVVNMAASAWTPVPGYTALKQGNKIGFVSAMGAVGAGTAASVYLAGHATYSAPQLVAMTALSSYGLTVFVNHLFLD